MDILDVNKESDDDSQSVCGTNYLDSNMWSLKHTEALDVPLE